MKRLLLILSLLFAGIISAEEKEKSAEPDDLTELREKWHEARKRATDPIDKKYASALESMKLRYTKAGKLTEALAVDKEIKSFATNSDKEKLEDSGGKQSRVSMKSISGRWSYTSKRGYSDIRVLNVDGTLIVNGNPNADWKWSIDGDSIKFSHNKKSSVIVLKAVQSGKKYKSAERENGDYYELLRLAK